MENINIFTWPNIKRYLISSLISFLGGFAIIFLTGIDSLSLESLKDGSMLGLIFAGIRGGVKLVIEGFLAWRARYQK